MDFQQIEEIVFHKVNHKKKLNAHKLQTILNGNSRKMKQALLEESQEWDIQFAERRLALVDDDIEATKKQIQSLEKQKNNLQEQYKNYEYTLDEIRTTIETLQINEFPDKASNDIDSEGDFFTLLSELENEEVALKSELESYHKLKKQLAHDRRKLLSTNSKIQSEVESDKLKLDNLQKEMQTTEDILKDLQYHIDSKTLHYNELFQQCSEMQQEELRITEELKVYGESLQADLQQAEKEQIKELEMAKKAEIEKEKSLANAQRNYQNQVNKKYKELQKESSISNWLNDRSLLIGKIRKAKTQLATEQQSIEGAEKRKAKIASDLKKALGDSDPGDGTGPKAKQMVRAEIEHLKSEKQLQASEDQIQTETDYNNELTQQLKLLTESVETFNRHKSETLNSLTEELNECSRDGYLKLLQNELAELQTQLNLCNC